MEEPFFRHGLSRFGIKILVPGAAERELVHRVIYGELVLGCPETPLLIRPEDTGLPLFDTARIHALATLDTALEHEIRRSC
jgi:aspartate racemase